MPDLLASLLATEGLAWIAGAAFLAGLVRGFAGFGTAMVFLPVAAQFLSPFGAILTLIFMDLLAPLPVLRPAWREVHRPDLGRLLAGCALVLPLGLWLLAQVSPEVFRYGVSLLALGMLAILAGGLRWRGAVPGQALWAIGGLGGFLGGVAGMPGPPVILFTMARPLGPAVIRATNLLYLFGYDLLIILWMALLGHLRPDYALLGLLLGLPGMAGNWLGGRLFNPAREGAYRGAAYVLIALSALSGLPLWG